MIWRKHLLSHSQRSFTSCISTPVTLQPVIDTIRFVRNRMSGLTTSEGSGSTQSHSRFCTACAGQCYTISFQTQWRSVQSHVCNLKGGRKMGQGRGQWQVAMHGWGMDEVEWNKNDWILFSHALTATYGRHSLPLTHGRCRVNCLLAKKKAVIAIKG